MTIAATLQAKGYALTPKPERSYADSLSRTVGLGRVHVALRADGSTAVYALGDADARPRSRAEFGSGVIAEVLAAVDAAEAELLRDAETAR